MHVFAWIKGVGRWKKSGAKPSNNFLWIALALWTGFTFVGYFVPIRELGGELLALQGGWQIFWVLFYGFAYVWQCGLTCVSRCASTCALMRAFKARCLTKIHWSSAMTPSVVKTVALAKRRGLQSPRLGRLYRLQVVCTGLPGWHRYSRWFAVRMHRLWLVCGCM